MSDHRTDAVPGVIRTGSVRRAAWHRDQAMGKARKPPSAAIAPNLLPMAKWAVKSRLDPWHGTPKTKTRLKFERLIDGGEGGIRTPMSLHPCRISSAVHSTTLPPLRGGRLALVGAEGVIAGGEGLANRQPGGHCGSTAALVPRPCLRPPRCQARRQAARCRLSATSPDIRLSFVLSPGPTQVKVWRRGCLA